MITSTESLTLLNPDRGNHSGMGSRLVYAIDSKTVVKLPGWRQDTTNDREYQFWVAIQGSKKWARHFFEIHDILFQTNGDTWLVMERALYVPPADPTYWSFLKQTDKDASAHLWDVARKFGIADIKPQNIGIKQDGTWGILDYGIHVFPRNYR